MIHSKRTWILIVAGILLLTAILAGTAELWGRNLTALSGKGYIAVIRIDGEIYGGPAGDFLSQGVASSEEIMAELEAARKDDNAKAVLIRINTPGGSTGATQEIVEEMDKIKNAGKPIVISMGDTCASAGYWIASKGDYIFASPATLTGSIGVYIDYTNVEGLAGKLGVTDEKIKSGAYKDMLSMYRPMVPEERAMLQGMVNDIYNQFVQSVAEGRHMDVAKVKTFADGRIMTGREAQNLGLVDAMGNYYDALDYAGGLVNMDGDVPVHTYDGGGSLRGFLNANMQHLGTWMGKGFADAVRSSAGTSSVSVR